MVTWGTPLGCCRALMTRAPKGYPSRRFPRHELPLGEAVGPTRSSSKAAESNAIALQLVGGGVLQKLVQRVRSQLFTDDYVQRWAGKIGLTVAVGAIYFLAAQFGLALLTTSERVVVFWPGSGIAAGTLIVLGLRMWVPVTAGVILATLAANLGAERSLWVALAFGLCNAGEALLMAWLIERWFGLGFTVDSLRRLLGFLAATVVATGTAAVGAACAMSLFGPSLVTFLGVWEVRFASGAFGMLTVAPMLIGIAALTHDPPRWRQLVEGTLALVLLAVMNGLALTVFVGPWSMIAPTAALFPLLLWLSVRYPPAFAAAGVFIIAVAIVWTTANGYGRYGDPSRPIADRVIAGQVDMLATALAVLALAALFAERRQHEMVVCESDTRQRSIL